MSFVGAGLWIFSSPGLAGETGTIELRVYDDLPTLGGAALAIGTLASGPQFYEAFWPPVPTNIGDTYYLQILHSLPAGATSNLAGNTYGGGTAYNNSVAFVNFDAPIRILTEPNVIGEVPEPSAFTLLGGV